MEAGIIAIWRASIGKIPNGWFLCDGNNGTPDLRDRIIVGAGDTFSVDDSGGSATHTHTIAIDDHTHDINAGSDIATGVFADDVTALAGATGSSDPAGERPPFMALAYIMRDSDGLQEFDAPRKLIVAWSGSIANIPEKWKLCDGTLNTPDLTDRFILGAGGAFTPSQTGGSINHQHDFTSISHEHAVAAGTSVDDRAGLGDFTDGTTPETVEGTSDAGGIIPPYYALAYIQKF